MSKHNKSRQKQKTAPALKSVAVTKAPMQKPVLDKPVSPVAGTSAPSPAEDRNQPNPVPGVVTMQQQRARFALKRVQQLHGTWQDNEKKQKEFNSYAKAMPFMIHTNGLGQTAAFYRRKGKEDTYYELYQLLGDWLSQPGQPFTDQTDLLDGITHTDMPTYLAAQAEAMLFLDWVAKFASAFMVSD
jgi:CRISPR-associated protein Cmr5